MASSSCASLAPTDFNISTSFEDANGAIIVAVERCQLCSGTKRTFYCKECILRGHFVHSKAKAPESPTPETYSQKLRRWQVLKGARSELLDSFKDVISKRLATEEKKMQVQFARQRVLLCLKAVESAQQQLKKEQAAIQRLREENHGRKGKSVRHEEKLIFINEYVERTIAYIEKQQPSLEHCHAELCTSRQNHIRDLLTYIFPIRETQPRSEQDSMVSALAEARHTAYVHGRWVYTDNGNEHQYQVIEPTLPGSGDYSAYYAWLVENRNSLTTADTEFGQRNPTYTVSAALSYTTQLVSQLSYYLGVHLPKRLCYSEFCGNELTECQFERAVYRLNHNILYLCFTQNVDPELLNAKHTVHNLLVMLDLPQLGRSGDFLINNELMQSVEDTLQVDPTSEPWSDSEDEVDHAEMDWEEVPCSLPDLEGPTRSTTCYISSSQFNDPGSQAPAGITGGLMSSVASLWRAATGTRDEPK